MEPLSPTPPLPPPPADPKAGLPFDWRELVRQVVSAALAALVAYFTATNCPR